MKWKLLGALLTVVIGLAAYGGKVLATPGNAGFQATTLAHATFGDLRLVAHGPTPRAWDALLLTHNQSDLYVQSNVWQPGGSTGWHTHPGPSLVIVTKGVLTEYEGDDPTCTPHVYDASNGPVGFVDPGGGHAHIIVNKGTAEADSIAVQLIPAGATRRIDVTPAPQNCGV